MSTEHVQRCFRVSGRVQGVGFRWWVAREARDLGLGGTVRNRPDGTVEVALAGEPEKVNKLALRLQQGPPGARVEQVSEFGPPERALPQSFEIVG
jgi:acylphosphatase